MPLFGWREILRWVVNCNIALKTCPWAGTQVIPICFSYTVECPYYDNKGQHEHKFSRTYDTGEILLSFVSDDTTTSINVCVYIYIYFSWINALSMLYGCKLYVFWHIHTYSPLWISYIHENVCSWKFHPFFKNNIQQWFIFRSKNTLLLLL